jgi:hypothetical protein
LQPVCWAWRAEILVSKAMPVMRESQVGAKQAALLAVEPLEVLAV